MRTRKKGSSSRSAPQIGVVAKDNHQSKKMTKKTYRDIWIDSAYFSKNTIEKKLLNTILSAMLFYLFVSSVDD